ncbi:unnamed protein product [Adineta steineri]|uniref:Uncharacterized protein n=1 Tax=Adineta steineri TaxID=433720 RepID=A0A818Z5A9_9BILA|nr:unnamed protein product [Adineta steineri]
MEIYHCICQYTKIPYEYCTTFKPLARIGQYRAHQTRPATNYKGALRDGIELHLTASEEKMPRFLLTATATDGQQKELPTTIIDPYLLRYLSHLRINCMKSLSFHRIITLLSSVLGQLSHFSLKLKAFTSISDPLNYISSFQMSVNPVDLFLHADTLFLCGYKKINCVQDLDNCRSSISSLVSWPLLTNISINHSHKSEFNICDAFYSWKWNPSCIVDGKNKLTRRIATLIYLLVDKLQKLVSLRIVISNSKFNDTPCFPRLIRRQLHQYPLNRPFRLRFSSNAIALWL